MATSISLTYFGMPGTGRTVTEAKKDAGAKIEAALKGSYTPRIFTHRGTAILMYREPDGWKARIIADPERGIIDGPVYGNSYADECSEKEVTGFVLEWLADITTTADDTDPPEFLKAPSAIREWRSKLEVQKRYRDALARGMNANDAHSYALKNPMRPELWQNEVA